MNLIQKDITTANIVKRSVGTKLKKIGFCITCMNRLHHIKETLEKNIRDNFYPNEVEFVLLDYNSSDGMEEWVKTLQYYIDIGILIYYRTTTPSWYKRGHSRNMSIRLSNAEIVCNLDADNFLGKDFCFYIIEAFKKEQRVFYSSNYLSQGAVGKVCTSKDHFEDVRGYDELFESYGFEDLDFYNRLRRTGLTQKYIQGTQFYKYVSHSNDERIIYDPVAKDLHKIYIAYQKPFISVFLLLYNNFRYKSGILRNNIDLECNVPYAESIEINDWLVDRRSHIVLESGITEGVLEKTEKSIDFVNDRKLFLKIKRELHLSDSLDFYELDNTLYSKVIMILGEAINYWIQCSRDEKPINRQGYGQGTVLRNFDYTNHITLL
nr:glycosyltransferase family A protein [uncultured Draconibacterium sp.]